MAEQGASKQTRGANARVAAELPFADRQDFEDAARGFIATLDGFPDTLPGGVPVWDLEKFAFLEADDVPDTVNPSLWRIAQLNMNNGLFEVVPGIYQVRGFDLSNVTFVEGETGVVVIDPLITAVQAAAALRLYRRERGDRPVIAVIHTHSHVDHYGGVKGVVSQDDVDAGQVQIIAPAGFLQEAVSENVYAGTAMSRRAIYQYGMLTPAGPTGAIDAGLGKATSLGPTTLIAPTLEITATGERHTIDGVEMEFYLAPDTEAPAEMLIWFPASKVLNAAEDVTHTMHNLYTLRGAQVRDARAWWKVLNDVVHRYGGDVQTIIAQHHWPTWGNERVVRLIEDQRDMFKYLHDQVLHLANQGLTMEEIAEQLTLPDTIGKCWHNRGYYGSVSHNAKAIYQRYLGWYDGNPAHLWPLPPADAAAKAVEYMGGAAAVLDRAQADFDAGHYRWVAQVTNQVVFADPSNTAARELCARALEQLGYQQENPTWRNAYLQGASELRQPVSRLAVTTASADTVAAMTADMLLDYMGIRLDGPRAAAQPHRRITWRLDDQHAYLLELRNGVLIYTATHPDSLPDADAQLTASKATLAALVMGQQTLAGAQGDGSAAVTGDAQVIDTLFGLLTDFDPRFNIVEP